jgi:transcriptional regulator with XRE-family HTH domain
MKTIDKPGAKPDRGLAFAISLRTWRSRQFLSQAELAARAGLSPAAIVTIESGRAYPRASTIRKLAKALEISPAHLLFDHVEEVAEPPAA